MENNNSSKVIVALVTIALLAGGYFIIRHKAAKDSDYQAETPGYEIEKPFTPPELSTDKADQVDGIFYFSAWQMSKDASGVVTFTTPENVVITYGGADSSECIEKPDGYLYATGGFETCLNSKRVAVSVDAGIGRTSLASQVFAAFIQLNLSEHGK